MFQEKPATNEAELNNIISASAAIEKLKEELTRMKDPLDQTLQKMFEITMAADGLNKTFIGNRARIREMMDAVSAVSPEIVGLGGDFKDAGKVIGEIAAGTRRTLIASKEDIREWFATSKDIGQDVSKLVEEFGKAGIMYSNISENVLDSIN